MKIYISLFLTFMKIGSFSFGGGYAMIPLIEREVVEKKHWISHTDIIDLFAISQTVPGAVAINTATLVGYKIARKKGAFAATLGVILPSFIIILIIAIFFGKVNPADAEPFFTGINGAILALIVITLVKMLKTAINSKFTFTIYVISTLAIASGKINPILVIVICFSLGSLIYLKQPTLAKKMIAKGEK